MKIADVSIPNHVTENLNRLNKIELGADASQQMVKISESLENALKPLDTSAFGKLS